MHSRAKRSITGSARGSTMLSMAAPYTRCHDQSVMAVIFLQPTESMSSFVSATRSVAGAAAATPMSVSSGA